MGNAAAIGRQLRADLSRTIRDSVIAGADAVVAASPVDTTHSRNNWVLSKKRPFTGVDGSPESPSTAAQERGRAELESYDVGRDGSIFLRNNVEYTRFLDDPGTSPQAEPGWVARAFQSAASLSPRGRERATRTMLRGMADAAFRRSL